MRRVAAHCRSTKTLAILTATLLAALAAAGERALAHQLPPPPDLRGAWINGYPPNSQWGSMPTRSSPDPRAATEIRSWRAYTRAAWRWEQIDLYVCTSRSIGPFTVELHETVGLNNRPRSHTATVRFSLRRSPLPEGRQFCRNVRYRWQPNPGVAERGEHQMIVYV